MGRSLECRPVGYLAQILDEYDAPRGVQNRIARRVGGVINPQGVQVPAVEKVIQNSMVNNGGIPEWSQITEKVGAMAREFYKKARGR